MHDFPQYRLEDLRDGTLDYADFAFLRGGMLASRYPEMAETTEEQVNRATMAVHLKAISGRSRRGW